MEGDTITPWRPSPSLGDGCIEVDVMGCERLCLRMRGSRLSLKII